jgi:glutamine amidotransferase
MSELFGLSSNRPAALTISLQAFARHGGLEGPHKDGWGVAYYEQKDVRLIKDAGAASESEWVRFLGGHRLRSTLILSHIRKATQDARTYSNTQPVVRELGGRMHVFAHNGGLKGLKDAAGFTLGRYHPVGDTDSEWAFCALLDRMTELWPGTAGVPDLNERLVRIARFAEALRPLGPANFIYGDGEVVALRNGQIVTAAKG